MATYTSTICLINIFLAKTAQKGKKMNNLAKIGHTYSMRSINQDIKGTIDKVKELKGESFIIKVNRGRNRIETIEGVVESTYPAIFTVRAAGGELNTFSYNDILSKNILFYRKSK